MNLSNISTEELERELRARQFHDQRQGEIYRGQRDPDAEDHLDDSHVDHGNRPIGFWRCY
jgi:hypothetical protein